MGNQNNRHRHDLELFARCASGFEQTLATELRGLGANRVRPLQGGVAFFGPTVIAYRTCLWSRVATRIQLVVARVPATDANALYAGVTNVAWEDHIAPKASIAVDAHGENPALRNSRFTALKVKDAICDRLRDARGSRPNVDAANPDLEVDVALHQKKATLYLNLSGPSLHRRGYREDGVQTEAPLKETLAAGMLLSADWPAIARTGGLLVDPMCGSGTLAIEAALIAANRAPGLLRRKWGFFGWARHDQGLWNDLVEEATEQQVPPRAGAVVLAGDVNASALDVARKNLARAQVDDLVRLYRGDVSTLRRQLQRWHADPDAKGLLVANPPYGQRLLAQEDLPRTYASLATGIEALPTGWRVALITPDAGIDTALGRIPLEVIPCFNGPIPTWIRRYDPSEKPLTCMVTSLCGRSCAVPIAEANSAQFAARLRKVAKERSRWARREQVSCYRLYDADLPDYAFSIDLFCDANQPGEHRHVRMVEHRRPNSVDEQSAVRRLSDAAALVSAILDLPRERLLAIPWSTSPSEHWWIRASEGPYSFEIDLTRPNARLSLAQRPLRALVGTMAQDKRMACLFGSGVSTLVHAAGSGAQSTVFVDASQTAIDHARNTMRENGLAHARHRFVCLDIPTWIANEARARHTYDLILCIAPLWLPKRDAGGREWDLRREFAPVVRDAARLLSNDGTLVLSCPDPSFEPDVHAPELGKLVVEDKSADLVPHDFERSREVPTTLFVRRRRQGTQ